MRSMENGPEQSDGNNFVRFWTDYERINKTHFWSDIANAWWSQCQSSDIVDPMEFRAAVMIDGYRTLRNFNASYEGLGELSIIFWLRSSNAFRKINRQVLERPLKKQAAFVY